MSTPSRTASGPQGSAPGDSSGSLLGDLSALYALAQDSRYVFASPVGPFAAGGRQAFLPRFVFFGPHASNESWRLAFLAGFDHRDLRASRALVALASSLAGDSAAGHALNLTFFPVIDVAGLLTGAAERGLAEASWGHGAPAEIDLLAADARQRGYHGFVRVETAGVDQSDLSLRVRGGHTSALSPDLELITDAQTHAFPVRLEAAPDASAVTDGPLSGTGFPIAPFELTLRIPGSWSDEAYQHAAVTLLERFLRRYRAFQAYGQHL